MLVLDHALGTYDFQEGSYWATQYFCIWPIYITNLQQSILKDLCQCKNM